MDHKERVAQGQNGGTKNEEKDGRTPFAGRVGINGRKPESLCLQGFRALLMIAAMLL